MALSKKKKGTHLFIDTNVLLNFYAFSNDDLQELEKLINILKTKVVKLYITQQVVDEFYRNRDSKLAASFDTFRPFGTASCPSFMTSVPEYQAYKKALILYKNARKALMEKTRAQADSRELLADQLFARIAKEAQVIPVDEKAYAAAEKRARLGNPPGKIGSTIGDQLNWELLLAKVPNGSDLHVISKDSDYASKLNPTQAKVFLTDEWKKAKQGNLYIHEQISLFFSANYPDEDFSLEIEKKSSIEALIGSGNFASTHAAIASLEPYIPFLTTEEAEEVLQGALSNSQVVWIASDPDVEAFLNKVLQEHGGAISETLRKRVEDILGLNPEDLNPDEVAVGEQDVPISLE